MAAVTFASGTDKILSKSGEGTVHLWISPSSMDSADTVILPTLAGKTPVILGGCFDATTGDLVTATLSTQTVTIDASGGTSDHVYHLQYTYM